MKIDLTDKVFVIQGQDFAQNATLILSDNAALLVDNRQNLPLAHELHNEIKSITDKPVKYVINTHYHCDHTFGNEVFRKTAEIIGHVNVQSALLNKGEEHKEFFRDYFGVPHTEEVTITPPNIAFEKSMTLDFGGQLIKIVHPGVAHTDTDSYVYLPEDQILITGDLFFNKILAFTGDPSARISGCLSALQQLEKIAIKIIIPGHGAPTTDITDMVNYRLYLEELLEAVGKELRKGCDLEHMLDSIKLPRIENWGHYDDWFAVNVKTAYQELKVLTS